jgi:hypothetical protein
MVTQYQLTGKKINLELIANPDRLNGFLRPKLSKTMNSHDSRYDEANGTVGKNTNRGISRKYPN